MKKAALALALASPKDLTCAYASTLFFLLCSIVLSACSTAPAVQEENPMSLSNQGSASLASELAASDEEEGPQYQQPTMEVLQGKAQRFPSRFPLKRYPKSKVVMVDVRENRPPGAKDIVMLLTVDQLNGISQFYQSRLLQESWKKTYEYKNSIYECSKWEKGEMECEVRICPELKTEDKKYIQLFTGKKFTFMASKKSPA